MLTLQIPRERMKSRYRGIWKLLARVRRWGFNPGNSRENPVAAGVRVPSQFPKFQVVEYCGSPSVPKLATGEKRDEM